MKSTSLLLAAVALLTAGSSFADSSVSKAVNAGIRVHQDHSFFEEYAYGDGDISFKMDYRIVRAPGFVEIGTLVTPDATGQSGLSTVFTPGISAMLSDNNLYGGLSILRSFDDSLSTLTDWYWQFGLGYAWNYSDTLAIEFGTAYPFEGFDDFSEFDAGDLEYVISITVAL